MSPARASAQTIATSFEELRTLVKPGDTIEVIVDGRKTRGRLGQLSPASLELLVRKTAPDGRDAFVRQAQLSEGDVQQIVVERRDSLWNGTLIGLGATALPGVYLVSYGLQATREHYRNGKDVVGGGVVVLGVGAGVGALIDAALNPRATVYYRPLDRRSFGVQVSPFLLKSGAGVQLSIGL